MTVQQPSSIRRVRFGFTVTFRVKVSVSDRVNSVKNHSVMPTLVDRSILQTF